MTTLLVCAFCLFGISVGTGMLSSYFFRTLKNKEPHPNGKHHQ